MLPKEYRLKEDWLIRRILRDGSRQHTPLFVVIWKKKASTQPRFAFIASKKVGKAVKRNRATRLLREAVFQLVDRIPTNNDYVFVARSTLIGKKMQDVVSILQKTLPKIK